MATWKISEERLNAYADHARRLSGRTGDMNAAQIEEALAGATAGSGKDPSFVTSAVGVLPVVVRGTASSEFSLTFETSATGAV